LVAELWVKVYLLQYHGIVISFLLHVGHFRQSVQVDRFPPARHTLRIDTVLNDMDFGKMGMVPLLTTFLLFSEFRSRRSAWGCELPLGGPERLLRSLLYTLTTLRFFWLSIDCLFIDPCRLKRP
jgi:hypothetical protein